MAKKCFIQKLAGNTNDTNLVELGVQRFKTFGTHEASINIANSRVVAVKGTFNGGQKEITTASSNAYAVVRPDTSNIVFDVYNKGKMLNIGGGDLECEDFSFLTSMETVGAALNLRINTSIGYCPKLRTLGYTNGFVEIGDTSGFTSDNLPALEILSGNIRKTGGGFIDIAELGRITTLNSLNIKLASPIGKIEGLAENMYKNGRKTGLLKIQANANLTFNNIKVGYLAKINIDFNDTGCQVKKDDALLGTYNNGEWIYVG